MAWAEAVTAISTAIIAVILIFTGMALISWMGDVRKLTSDLTRLTGSLDHDIRPTLQTVRKLADDASSVVGIVRTEIGAIVKTSRGLRRRVDETVDSVEERLQDLDALLDVVLGEVEDTALDVAAALRTARRGGSIVRRVKRAVLGRRR